MIRYKLRIEIEKPLKEVTTLFSNRSLFPQWQPGLLNTEQIESHPYPKYTHQLALGRRKMTMTETIIRNELPDHFDETYALKGVTNTVYNSFEATPSNHTLWTCDTEYTFRGIMRLISLFMKKGFQEQSRLIMSNFKLFAESQRQ